MAIELINIGNIANDGTGDDLREAMIKINANFEEIDLRDDEQTTASNLGNGEAVFAGKLNYDLQYKTLIAGTDVTINSSENEITINADGGLKTLQIDADTGNIVVSTNDAVLFEGGNQISTTVTSSGLGQDVLQISYTGWEKLQDDPFPVLGNNLNASNFNVYNVNTLNATNLTGLLIGDTIGNVHGIDIRDIYLYFNGYYDFGDLGKTYTSIIEWIAESADVDFGTIQNPDIRTIDLGLL